MAIPAEGTIAAIERLVSHSQSSSRGLFVNDSANSSHGSNFEEARIANHPLVGRPPAFTAILIRRQPLPILGNNNINISIDKSILFQ
jgi:hypothetical protein